MVSLLPGNYIHFTYASSNYKFVSTIIKLFVKIIMSVSFQQLANQAASRGETKASHAFNIVHIWGIKLQVLGRQNIAQKWNHLKVDRCSLKPRASTLKMCNLIYSPEKWTEVHPLKALL